MVDNNQTNVIGYEDMALIRKLASQYNMSVADFGRAIVRQAERNLYRFIRLSDAEYELITDKAQKHGVTINRWCALACHIFLQTRDKENYFYNLNSKETGKREKRISVSLQNRGDDAEMQRIATEYSLKISTLIRYCAVHFDGKEIK